MKFPSEIFECGKIERQSPEILNDIAPIHCCKARNLWIGIYNGEMVFNRFLGNSWSDLDDFFGTPP